ncbi:MAG: CRISPR-associated endonuclease Cas1 [Thermoprotei archaeon]|jgi:CRISPR-associated protein Cas1
MNKVAIVDKYGAFLAVKDGRFQLRYKNEVLWDLAPVELEAIVFTVTGASISVAAIKLANEFFIDLVFMDGNEPIARLIQARYGPPIKTWVKQIRVYKNSRVKLARFFIEGKIHNQRVVLSDYAKRFRAASKPNYELESIVNQLMKLESQIEEVNTVDKVREIEAVAARYYWGQVAKLVPSSIGFINRIPRSRKPVIGDIDPFNKALNIGYSALLKEVWKAIFIVGLNPYLGFLHSPRAGKMVLAFDLMEEFRPVAVDRPLITIARNNTDILLKLKDENSESIKEIWRTVIKYMKESKPSIQSLILEQARKLASYIRGEGEYKPFKARW